LPVVVPCRDFLEKRRVKFIEWARLRKLKLKLMQRRSKRRTIQSAEEKFDDMESDTAVL